MRRILPLALLTLAISAHPQQPTHPKPLDPKAPDKWVDRVNELQAKARTILTAEFARQPADGCGASKSTAEFGNCLNADYQITNRHYLQFTRVLQSSFAVPDPEAPTDIYPTGERAFAAGEAAWLIYREKTCLALQDTYDGGTAGPLAETDCKSSLTREHIKELGDIHLPTT